MNKLLKILRKKIPLILIGVFLATAVILLVVVFKSRGAEIEFISDKTNFQLNENLEFKFDYQENKNIFEKLFAGIFGVAKKGKPDIKVDIYGPNGEKIERTLSDVEYQNNGEIAVDLTRLSRDYAPGKYKIELTIKDGDRVFNTEQDFTLGVLAINTNKSIYTPGEIAYLQLAVLKDNGHTVCNTPIQLQITNPESQTTILSTTDKTIQSSEKCAGDNLTDVPDYSARYQVSEPGKYKIKMTNLANGYEIIDYFEVRNSVPFDIERIGPTRINPKFAYEIKLKIKANEDYEGQISDIVPLTFVVKDGAGIKQESNIDDYTKKIIWDLNLQKGKTYELKYTFDALDISPYLYALGPLKINNFQEARYWQVASDQVASGIIVAWPSTAASIPAGWTRVTALDTYYLYGTTSNPSASAGGSATHTHTESGHTHTIDHNHGGSATTGEPTGAFSYYDVGTGTRSAITTHTHTATIGTYSGSNNSKAANVGTASNDPPYTKVIFIESDGTTEIPAGAWAMFDSNTLPSNWARTNTNKFLKGANAGGNGGATGGSSDAHTHTDSGHTHTENAHTHTATTNATLSKSGAVPVDFPVTVAAGTHTHTISGGSTTATEGSGTALFADADGQPPWYKLNIIQNNNVGADLPGNTIAIWTGTIANIPANWVVCDGSNNTPNLNNKFIKGAATDGQLNNTGGALTHTHASGGSHTHAINSHTHTFTVANNTSSNTAEENLGGGKDALTVTHAHTLSVSGGSTTGSASPTLNANTSGSNLPPYKEAVFIQYQPTMTISGICQKADQSTSCANSETIKVAVNGNLQAQTGTTSGGSWSISGLTMPSSGDVITVFVDGVADLLEAAAVTKFDGSGITMTGIVLYEMHLTIGSDDAQTISNTNLSQYDNSVSGDEDIFFEASATSLQSCYPDGCESAEIYVLANNTYQPNTSGSSYVKTHDIEIDGTFDLTGASNYASVSGTWDNNSVFTAGSSWVYLTATSSTEIIDSTGASTASFGVLVFGENATSSYAGHWNLSSALDVNSTLSINGGTLDMNGANNINVAGGLVISPDGDYTKNTGTFTFDGSGTSSWYDFRATKADMGTVSINGSTKTVNLGYSVKATTVTVASGQTLGLSSSGYTLTITGSGQAGSRPFQVAGTLSEGTDSMVEFTGSSATDIEAETYHDLKLNNSATTFYSYGNITVAGQLNVLAGTLNAQNDTWTLSGTGAAFTSSGTFTTNTSTFNFAGDGATTIASGSYYNLQAGNITTNTANRIYTLDGNIAVSNALTIGASSGTYTNYLDASSYTLTLSGTGASVFTVNSKGGFTATTSTVVYTGNAATTVGALNGASHYYNLTIGLASDTNTFSYTAGGEIEASGSLTLIAGSSGVHTFDMASNNLSIGGGAANTGGIAVPARTVFTQTSGTTKVYSASGSATVGGAGTTKFYNFTIGNSSDGASYTFILGGDVGASSSFSFSAGGVGTHVFTLSSYELGVWSNFTVGTNASLSSQTGTLNFGGTGNTTYTNSGSCEPYNLTINKTTAASDNFTLASALIVRNTITITDGHLVQGNYNVQSEGTSAVSVAANGEWSDVGTGDLILGGGFANVGSISFVANESDTCENLADDIQILSTANGVQRTWSGAGSFTMYNLYVADMTRSDSPNITVYSGTNSNVTGNWTFSDCPVFVKQLHYRWRNDDGNESSATWKRGEDNAYSSGAKLENIRLRFSIQNTGTPANDYQYQLQVASQGSYADCGSVPSASYSNVPTTTGGCGSSVACMTASNNIADGGTTTNQLSSGGTWVAGAMVEDPSNITSNITLAQDYFTEIEFNFQLTNNAVTGAGYCFRVTNNGAPLNEYSQIAKIGVVPPSSNFNLLRGGIRLKGGIRIK